MFVVPDSRTDSTAHGEQDPEGRDRHDQPQEVEIVEALGTQHIHDPHQVLPDEETVQANDQTVFGVSDGGRNGVELGRY